MSFINDNYDKIKIGFEGEEIVRNWIKTKKYKFCQIDIAFKSDGRWFLGEVKAQEKFKAPPFDGHGLPEWQIKTRLELYNDTGITPFLFVYDLDEKCLYIQSMIKLFNGEKFVTKNTKRMIFPLESFERIKI